MGCRNIYTTKKTGDVRVLTDFRELNKCLKRKPYPIPKIKDLLQTLMGFQWATALDLSQGYYHIPLDEESQQLCTFMMPWGKYRYTKLPMGVKVAVDIFQEVMTKLFVGLDFVRVYLDDILIISNGTLEDHMNKAALVLERLQLADFRVNVRKSVFAVHETEYLGYWLTTKGLQPQAKKVEALMRLTPPKTKRQLRRFLGMVNYYRDMWRRRSHLLAPLSAMVSEKTKFVWEDEQQKAFDEIKAVMSRETLLSFPDFSKEFHIYTDASDFQLGAVIMQNDKPLAFYSRKLNSAQKNYSTGEQELLSIVETLKEFKDILYGHSIIVHTDHKNLLYQKLATQRLVRWRMLIEEYDTTFIHVAGIDNLVADALSRLDADFEKDIKPPTQNEQGIFHAFCMSRLDSEQETLSEFINQPDSLDMACSFMLNRETKECDFPLYPPMIAKYQKDDKKLKTSMLKTTTEDYTTKKVEGVELIHYLGKIYVPQRLQSRVVAWYHEYLAHPGEKRTEETIAQWLTWPGLRREVRGFCRTCKQCQVWKRQRKKYGHLPAKQAESEPWEQCHVDLIGPFTIRTPKRKYKLLALTCIDPATGWFEVVELPNKLARTVMDAFNNAWLTRYPRPKLICFDNGNEFKAIFKELCDNYGLVSKPTTTYNPLANGIIERIHQVLGDSLRTFELENIELPQYDPFGSFLNATAWAICSTYHTTLQATPGQLVFGRDMLLSLPF